MQKSIDTARHLWLSFKRAPAQKQPEVDLMLYERWQQEVYLQDEGADGDDFDQFIKVTITCSRYSTILIHDNC
jgi:hypothetical protein